jgi:hypothetical protein
VTTSPAPHGPANLLALHSANPDGTQPDGCICPRALCGGSASGPGIQAGCQAHGAITRTFHHAYDCPQLPADADLSRLWIVVTKWTADGPVVIDTIAFDRDRLESMTGTNALWDVSEGDNAEDAVRAWQDRIDAMNAANAARYAAQAATARLQASARRTALAELLNTDRRALADL